MGQRQRVLIVHHHDLFFEGLKSLLESEDDILVVGAVTDTAAVAEQVERLSPEMVIVDASDGELGEAVTRLLRHKLPTKMAYLSLDDNQMCVVTKQWISDATGEDLISAIRPRTD